jgi:hypothetical protein
MTTDARTCRQARTLGGALRLFASFPTPRVLAASVLVWALLRASAGAWGLTDTLIVVGVVVWWPFQEWLLHVALLHFRPRTVWGRRIDPLAARTHRWHHRNPWIVEGIFLPPAFLWVLTPLHALVWWTLCSSPAHALTGVTAYTAAALVYEWTHFIAHMPYTPRSRYAKTICRNHQLHHFKNERYWHAFTVPAIDRLMGTGPDPAGVPRSDTVRTLGVDEDADAGAQG